MTDKVARGEIRVIVERSGLPIAARVSADDFTRWSQWDEQRRARLEVIDRMRAAFADFPTEEIEQEVEGALAEVRAEMTGDKEFGQSLLDRRVVLRPSPCARQRCGLSGSRWGFSPRMRNDPTGCRMRNEIPNLLRPPPCTS